MFKNKFLYLVLAGTVTVGTFTSCNDFLDVVPDNRTEIDSKVKAQELLVSAYPETGFAEMGELMSDNVSDNGTRYSVFSRMVSECYYWNNVSEQTQDSPFAMWSNNYKAIAATNQVLQYVNDKSDDDLKAIKGEALIARAYAHFFLANVFCQPYSKETSETDLGIPFIDDPNYSITDVPSRLTVAEVYRKINSDIEEGLPLIDDGIYSAANIAKYHFNKKAAYAFAAQFNLYYGQYDKAIEYATVALGKNPSSVLRNYKDFTVMSSPEDIAKTWTRADRDNNFLLITLNSNWALSHKAEGRYTFNIDKCREVIWADGPWGSTNNTYVGKLTYGSDAMIYIPKYFHYFETLDVVSQSGYWRLVNPEFTGDETLLCRAEAYALKNDLNAAAADLDIWARNFTSTGFGLDKSKIINFMNNDAIAAMKTPLNPKFTINAGEQTSFLQFLLWVRRCETIHTGKRFFDIKRYGLGVVHNVVNEPSMTLTTDDLRKVVQIPESVVSSGVQANPR